MAHLEFEWVKRRQQAFTSSSTEFFVVGEPVDVGDWEEMVVQIDTLAVEGSISAENIKANVETALSADDTPGWDRCNATSTSVSINSDGYAIVKVTPASEHGLRKWARLVLIHTVTTAGQKITIHARCLLKKRTP